MKILMITPYVPYPTSSGGQIRTFNLLKYLSRKNEIVLVCLYKFDKEKQYESFLRPYCKKIYFCRRPEKPWQIKTIFKAVFSSQPFLIVRNFSEEAKNVLQQLFSDENFDVIHVETFYVMPHLPKTNTPILLVEQTIEYEVYRHFVDSLPFFIRFLFLTDIVKLKYWERYYWNKADMVAAVCESDKKIITSLEGKIKPTIVPNGAGDEMIVKNLSKKKNQMPVLLFQGNFLWLQNTEAANYLVEKIYPLLENRLDRFKLIIAGQSASKKIKPLSEKNIEVIDVESKNNHLVKNLYQESTLFIAPIFGPGGTRLKILAAMASGLPVVSTRIGVEGLDVKDGQEVMIANSPMEFVEKIGSILRDEKQYETIRSNAHRLIDRIYNWEKISKNLEVVYQKLTKK
ncbi:glycosyltransferase family 4 protein [Candidatus Roizmanbacteria bacterium]|nr:glycosyltransferase family 4 protein [Candidatus Roizmanbacteria bacterium]